MSHESTCGVKKGGRESKLEEFSMVKETVTVRTSPNERIEVGCKAGTDARV
jgi:hypothetical protein